MDGCDPRLVRGVHAAGANRAQWLERLSYCGSDGSAGATAAVSRNAQAWALTALVVALVTVEALLWEGDMK